MGDVGNFFLGGSKNKNSSENESSSTSTQTSANQSSQGSISSSANASKAASNAYNLGYAPIAQAMSPTLGMTAAGGNMLGALLGVPGYTMNSGPAVNYATTTPPPLPGGGKGGADATASPASLLTMLQAALKANAPAAPTQPTSPVAPAPAIPTAPPTTTAPIVPSAGGGGGGPLAQWHGRPMQQRELGGPVNKGQPYIVGERRPEVFVPDQPGTILPAVPPQGTMMHTMLAGGGGRNDPRIRPVKPPKGGVLPPVVTPPVVPTVPTTPAPPAPPVYDPAAQSAAITNWADSAGQKFLMDQGVRAINAGNAGTGTFQSGARDIAFQKMGMGLGSTYQQQYINNLLEFSKLGLGGASAMSGAGGVNGSTSSSSGGSNSVSLGNSSGSSYGSSNSSSSGTSSGSGNTKNGLLPALSSFVPGN